MECSRCGSQNVRTFEMAHASYNVRPGSWNRLYKALLFGPLGFL
jgi:hypothetical protein